jgi:hypothetical protein
MVAPTWPLETERLTLRPFAADDLVSLHEMHSDEAVVHWLYNDVRSLEETRELLDRKIAGGRLAREGQWMSAAAVLRETGGLVGDLTSVGERGAQAGRAGLHRPSASSGARIRDGGGSAASAVRVRGARPASCRRDSRGPKQRLRAGAREARHASRGSPRRERVGEGRVAERARLRDPRPRVAGRTPPQLIEGWSPSPAT